MATFDLYIDPTLGNGGSAVAGLADSTVVQLPPFVQGDSIDFRVWQLKPNSVNRQTEPYSFAIPDTIEMAIGLRTGTSTTLYAQQYSWTASGEPDNPFFSAILPMNTAGIDTLLGSASSNDAWFEVKSITGGLSTTILQKQIKVQAAVIKPTSLTVPAGATPLSAEAAAAIYLTRNITGTITLICATDPTKKVALYCDTDGTFHADPVA